MTKKTIAELPDGSTVRESKAVVAFEQDGTTFQGLVAPIASNVIYATSETQLLSELPNLAIPDGETRVIYIDVPNLVLTQPFLFGDGSQLQIRSNTAGQITYGNTTAGQPLFQNPTGTINILQIDQVNITSNGINELMDLSMANTGFINLIRCIFINFLGMGPANGGSLIYDTIRPVFFQRGHIMRNNIAITIKTAGFQPVIANNAVFFTMIASPTIPADININDARFASGEDGHAMFFIDPNFITGSAIVLEKSVVQNTTPFYQTGSVIPASAISAGASTNDTKFTISGHSLVVGQAIVFSGFTGQTNYNVTGIVTVVDDINTVDVDIVFTAADSTGSSDPTSLDQTDIRVLSQNNPNQSASMATGEVGIETFVAPITIASIGQDAFAVISDAAPLANYASNNLERIEDDTVTTGQGRLKILDTTKRKYRISYSSTLEKTGGGGTDVGIILLKDGANVSFNPPHTVNTGKIQIKGEEILELVFPDVVQIATINYDATDATISISQTNLVVGVSAPI